MLRRFTLRQDSGRIVNISSVVGHTGNGGQSRNDGESRDRRADQAMAKELAGRAILVNSVAPGFIDTEMTAGLPAERRAEILARVPLGRLGSAAEVADTVAWLATRAPYVHGTVIHVNGGLYGG